MRYSGPHGDDAPATRAPLKYPQQAKLAELISARDGLIRDKIALQNQAKN
jgi:hypothetical protein